MNTANLFKLATHEDLLHIHKSLGIFCLLNFGYRYTLLFAKGHMDLHNVFGICSILTHAALSCSSLIFHISSVRNPTKPMIYPEYRLHSIAFALRSVVCCLICYFRGHYAYKIVTIYATMGIADWITYNENANNKNKKIKNGTTMKNMPFDSDKFSLEEQSKITLMNSSMQIGATLYMLGNIDSAFSPIFGIQLAALLMTLVRKNIITSHMWYLLYAYSLWINIACYFSNLPFSFILFQFTAYEMYIKIFFKYKINKYVNWTIILSLFVLYKETVNEELVVSYIHIDMQLLFRYAFVILYLVRQPYKCKSLFQNIAPTLINIK